MKMTKMITMTMTVKTITMALMTLSLLNGVTELKAQESGNEVAKDQTSKKSEQGIVMKTLGFFMGEKALVYKCEEENPETDGDQKALGNTSQKRVDQIHYLAREVDKLFRENGIKYTLLGGSILGARRHKGMIPWDDDIDIAVLGEDLGGPMGNLFTTPRVWKLQKQLKEKGLGIRWTHVGVQIYFLRDDLITVGGYNSDNNPIPKMAQFKDAFMDIFPLIKSKDNDGKEVYVYGWIAKNMWPDERIPVEAWNRLEDMDFGPLKLMGLNESDSKEYLDRAYGPSWSKVAYRTYNHEHMSGSQAEKKVMITEFNCANPTDPQCSYNPKWKQGK